MPVDASRLHSRLARYKANTPAAANAALTAMLAPAVAELVRSAPRDTNRYAAAWAQAANAAGLGPIGVPEIVAGHFAAKALPRLKSQAAFWQRIVERYERQGRTSDKWYRKAVRTLERANEELAKWDEAAVIIFGGKGRNLKVTVRNKVYGGTGRRILRGDGRVAYFLHNKEPHASIVEARARGLATVLAKLRTLGVRRGRAAFVRELKKGDRAAA
jgi:hypothetical protein